MKSVILALIFGSTGGTLGLLNYSLPNSPIPPTIPAPCTEDGCSICDSNGCDLLEGQWTECVDYIVSKRCVEYDGIPPAHCANVRIDNYNIWQGNPFPELAGTCTRGHCENGTVTSIVCTNPWIAPWLGSEETRER